MNIHIDPAIQKIHDTLFTEKEISLSVLRLDELHPFISGNKLYKLKYNIQEFFKLKKEYLVTFGGAYSNHLIATAAAGKEFGFKTIGIIRGDELHDDSNPALRFASQCGMKLIFVSRYDYRNILASASFEIDCDFLKSIPAFMNFGFQPGSNRYPDLFFLPEGGSNVLAVQGCAEIPKEINTDFDFICCACGTGATLAGISTGLNENEKTIGISVLQGEKFLENTILKMNGNKNNFRLIHDYSFGGYAKSNAGLNLFCENFFFSHKIKIEPVYTGKLFYGLFDLIRKDFFRKGTKIIAVHTGGVSDHLNE